MHWGTVHTNPFSKQSCFAPDKAIFHLSTTPKTITGNGAIRCFLVWTEKTMLSENGDVIKIDTIRRQTTRPWVSKTADRRYHVAFLLICVVVWTDKNDRKTLSVDANLFENGAKQRISVDRAWETVIFSIKSQCQIAVVVRFSVVSPWIKLSRR